MTHDRISHFYFLLEEYVTPYTILLVEIKMNFIKSYKFHVNLVGHYKFQSRVCLRTLNI